MYECFLPSSGELRPLFFTCDASPIVRGGADNASDVRAVTVDVHRIACLSLEVVASIVVHVTIPCKKAKKPRAFVCGTAGSEKF